MDLSRRFNEARITGILHLNDCNLTKIPPEVFTLKDLIRLDLGFNCLQELPPQIGDFHKLEQLWLNHNPLKSLPAELQQCKKLRALDIRHTSLTTLPRELGRVKGLVEVDAEGTSLHSHLATAVANGTRALLKVLAKEDQRQLLMAQLDSCLYEGIYREVGSLVGGKEKIAVLVKSMFREFTDEDEQRNLIRNADRMFPEDIETANPKKIRKTFVRLKRENEKKKLSAELELKLRAIYFDRIKVELVEGIVKAIYEHVTTLEDIQFLLKHARTLMPEHARDIDAAQLKRDLVALQEKLAAERAAALKGLHQALRGLYSHVEPGHVVNLLDAVAERFQRTDDIKKLTADVRQFFPVEFESAEPRQIRKTFVAAKKEAAALLA